MRHHHTGSRPHVQGSRRPLRVRHSARNLADAGGLVLLRKLFDRLIDGRTNEEKGFYRPGLMTEVWIALLLYGGGVIDDLPLLERRGVRRIFGWTHVPDPTTFGRWTNAAPRRAGAAPPIIRLWCSSRRRATAWEYAGGRATPTPPREPWSG